MNINTEKFIFDIDEKQFAEFVIEKSKEKLILVDFWAPWCGPCKQLTPTLEKIVNDSTGKFFLVKINIDENQGIAAQLQIQSIPAVFAFKDGKPVDAFQGVLPEKKIIEFIEKSLGEKINNDHSVFYDETIALLNNNKFEDVQNLIVSFIANHPSEYKAISIYLDSLVGQKKYTEAQDLYDSLNDIAKKDEFVISSYKKYSLKKNQSDSPSLEFLENEFNKNNKNIDLLLRLSDKYFAEDMHNDAFELLLNNFLKNKERIKPKFIKFFEALGNSHAKTVEFRKKLSSIMFS